VPPSEFTEVLRNLHSDIREFGSQLGDIRSDIGELKGDVKAMDKRVDKLEATVASSNRPTSKITPPGGSMVPPVFKGNGLQLWAIRILAPLLLAAVLGLIGFGFYCGATGGSGDETTKALRAVTDMTAKLAKDVARIEGAIDGAAEPLPADE
jgi:hypothetical protein